MSRRTPLPPPPPPEHIRAWPGPEAMLADRARAMDELIARDLGAGRLARFWLLVGGAALGWGIVGLALQAFEGPGDPLTAVFGAAFGAVGLAGVVACWIFIGLGVRRDRAIRQLVVAWADLGRGHGSSASSAAPWRVPGLSLAWVLSAVVVCGLGLWSSLGFAVRARPGSETYVDAVFFIGLGVILWVAGLICAAKAVGHFRWAVRAVG
ncbi:hypothetical protein [Streptomyces sp. ISL-100]|uniref:hypothetical protein n=1 Tax=Streptomyces sp. ISL-100 TaxID=2819173 RepID=UPI001BEB7A9D|nr:hypothetical protein [Streptomyces sp. ISL-100]MBT2396039.1 hypothetical protein [Streptomyces sp. ISL-100]